MKFTTAGFSTLFLFGLAISLAACGGNSGPTDSGMTTDSGTTADAATDSGTTADAATDSGSTADAATDSGTTADAATDSGTTADAATDSGTTADSGAPDCAAACAHAEVVCPTNFPPAANPGCLSDCARLGPATVVPCVLATTDCAAFACF